MLERRQDSLLIGMRNRLPTGRGSRTAIDDLVDSAFRIPLADKGSGEVDTSTSNGTAATFTRATIATTFAKLSEPYVTFPDTVGSYASASGDAYIGSGDIDIRAKVTAIDWTPTTNHSEYAIIAKDDGGGVGAARQFGFRIMTTGVLNLYAATNGTTIDVNTNSTVAVTTNPNETWWVRATRSATTGDVTFYKSSDGVTWDQLGDVKTGLVAGSIADTDAILNVGARIGGGNSPFNGKIYFVEIKDSIDGTAVVKFDPNNCQSWMGTTWTSSTGEVWTLNGGTYLIQGHVVDIASGTPRSLYNPETGEYLGYWAEGGRTNLCLQSEDFATTWSLVAGSASVVTTNTHYAPDGTLTADTLTDNDAAAFEGVRQSFTVADDSLDHVFSIFVKKTTGGTAPTFGVNLNLIGGAPNVSSPMRLNTDTGAVSFGVTVEEFPDYWRISRAITNNSSGNTTLRVDLFPAVSPYDESPTTAEDVNTATGTCVVWGAQLEKASFASSYIPTTTASVTRNADLLTYPASGNLSAAPASFYCEVNWPNATAGQRALVVDDGTANERLMDMLINATNAVQAFGNAASVQQFSIVRTGLIAGVTAKFAATVATNYAQVCLDGVLGVADTVVTPSTAFNKIVIADLIGTSQAFGTIKNVRIWQRQLPDATLQYLTT